MPYQINQTLCKKSGHCAEECPMGAIGYSTLNDRYELDPDLCTDCGSCADVCPVGAVSGIDDCEAPPDTSSSESCHPK